jgi:hypothetical protein
MAEGVLGMKSLSPWELCEGNLEGGLPPRDPERYLEKSLGRVSLYIVAPLLGNQEESMLAGDFKGWMKELCLHPSGESIGGPGGGLPYRIT